MEPEVLKS